MPEGRNVMFRSNEEFLAARLGFAQPVRIDSWVGISSDAMVQEALTGRAVDSFDYPSDLADLSRCCATFAAAPWELKEKMLPRLLAYCEHLSPRPPLPEPSKSWPWERLLSGVKKLYYDVERARA